MYISTLADPMECLVERVSRIEDMHIKVLDSMNCQKWQPRNALLHSVSVQPWSTSHSRHICICQNLIDCHQPQHLVIQTLWLQVHFAHQVYNRIPLRLWTTVFLVNPLQYVQLTNWCDLIGVERSSKGKSCKPSTLTQWLARKTFWWSHNGKMYSKWY